MVTLLVCSRDGKQEVVELRDQPLTLGRAESCDIVLHNDGEVSREHARVWLNERGQIIVADTNSKNGTSVDDGASFQNETHRALHKIHIGEHEISITGATAPEVGDDTTVTFMADSPDRVGNTSFFPSSRGLDLNQQRLTLLMSLADRIGGAFDRKQLLEQALNACCEALNFERGLIVLKTPRGEPEQPITRNVDRDETGAYKVSRTLINRALLHGERAVVNNPATDLIGNITESLVRFPISSALCVPILHRGDILGAIYGDRVTQATTYAERDVDFLAAIAQQVGIGLANQRLVQEYVKAQTLYAGLEAARRIQRDLLPAAPLEAGRVLMDGYNEPSSLVGGDYFDYFRLSNDLAGFIIADVTGHGLPAALVMANFQGAVHTALTAGVPLPTLAAQVNRLVYRNTADDVFITAILGTIDTKIGTLEFISAGHPAPILVGSRNPPPDFEQNALPLGIDPEDSYIVQRIQPSEHAGTIFFYTDGLTESPDPQGRLLGLNRIQSELADVTNPSTEIALRIALSTVRQHLAGGKNPDDLTLLAIQLKEN